MLMEWMSLKSVSTFVASPTLSSILSMSSAPQAANLVRTHSRGLFSPGRSISLAVGLILRCLVELGGVRLRAVGSLNGGQLCLAFVLEGDLLGGSGSSVGGPAALQLKQAPAEANFIASSLPRPLLLAYSYTLVGPEKELVYVCVGSSALGAFPLFLPEHLPLSSRRAWYSASVRLLV